MRLNVKLSDGAPLPRHARPGDAGIDLTSTETVEIMPGGTVLVGTGVRMELPAGYFGMLAPRSGMASKRGITLANTPSVIDSSYRGEIKLALHNMAPSHVFVDGECVPNWDGKVTVERGERVAQMIVLAHETLECIAVDELSESSRGEGGFGSTGLKAIE